MEAVVPQQQGPVGYWERWVYKEMHLEQKKVRRWCVASEVAGYGLLHGAEGCHAGGLGEAVSVLVWSLHVMERNIASPLKLGAANKEDERSLRGNPGWCGASVARGEGATGGGEEVFVKAACGWEVWLCSIPRGGQGGDYSPGGSDLGLEEAASLLHQEERSDEVLGWEPRARETHGVCTGTQR